MTRHSIERRQALLRLGALAATGVLGSTTLAHAQTAAPAAGTPLPVVASFSILADWLQQVGGPQLAVTTLVGPDGDAHAFNPSAQDARKLQGARLLVVNGLGFEGWLARLEKASGFKGRKIVASQGVKARHFEEDDDHDHDHAHGDHGHDHGPLDPHAWQDVANARLYVRNIAQGLAQADPTNAARYGERAAAYDQQLQQLDADIRRAVAAIPQARRHLVTTHDAFGYFEQAYGIRFIGARGLSNEAEPSAADVARLVSQIRADKIPAVFLENIGDPRLMEQLARESSAKVGGRLYSDALSPPGQPGATYVEMMRSNLSELVAALG
ncbi:MAG: Manganese-binding lipoprotein MntA [Paracidovorax wautersii]|uniref:Manganese-binding lipoprotein MntA n=1 Tax=Paracidovorax wautersii TaxID=1177982 RepID=A0A7V8JPH9_9BURK|nr:MAG: Manganese-binding lipoprotein MntA [Paracidovorax wautersii]